MHGASGDLTTTSPTYYMAKLVRNGRWQAAWSECSRAAVHHLYLAGRRSWSDWNNARWRSAWAPRASEEAQRLAPVLAYPDIASGLAGFQRVGARFGLEMRDPWADQRVAFRPRTPPAAIAPIAKPDAPASASAESHTIGVHPLGLLDARLAAQLNA